MTTDDLAPVELQPLVQWVPFGWGPVNVLAVANVKDLAGTQWLEELVETLAPKGDSAQAMRPTKYWQQSNPRLVSPVVSSATLPLFSAPNYPSKASEPKTAAVVAVGLLVAGMGIYFLTRNSG